LGEEKTTYNSMFQPYSDMSEYSSENSSLEINKDIPTTYSSMFQPYSYEMEYSSENSLTEIDKSHNPIIKRSSGNHFRHGYEHFIHYVHHDHWYYTPSYYYGVKL